MDWHVLWTMCKELTVGGVNLIGRTVYSPLLNLENAIL